MTKQQKNLNVALWIVQVLLAVTLAWSVAMKLGQPVEKLAEMWPWAGENPGLVKLTGVLDLLAGLGLILPSLLRILPRFTVYAAIGIIALMLAAIIFHIMRGEASQIGINVVVSLLAAFVVWGRWGKGSDKA